MPESELSKTNWTLHRFSKGQGMVSHRSLEVTGTQYYLTVRMKDSAWQWMIYDRSQHDAHGSPMAIDGGNEPNLTLAKRRAIAAVEEL